MDTEQTFPPSADQNGPIALALKKAFESQKHRRQSYPEYRNFIQHHYDGIAGKLTAVSGFLTGHALLAGQVLQPTAFDVSGCKRILDAGCGNGRNCKYILRRADADAFIGAFDLSQRMLKRAKRRLKSKRIHYVAADLTRLPYVAGYFDAIVCGWVLEHLPDPHPGLRELTRIFLESYGYRVLSAGSAEQAVEVSDQFGEPIHLLLTDVIMPGISGRQLAEKILTKRPKTRILYMTGYTDDMVVQHKVLEPGVQLLQKPFTKAELALKVRATLDSRN